MMCSANFSSLQASDVPVVASPHHEMTSQKGLSFGEVFVM